MRDYKVYEDKRTFRTNDKMFCYNPKTGKEQVYDLNTWIIRSVKSTIFEVCDYFVIEYKHSSVKRFYNDKEMFLDEINGYRINAIKKITGYITEEKAATKNKPYSHLVWHRVAKFNKRKKEWELL